MSPIFPRYVVLGPVLPQNNSPLCKWHGQTPTLRRTACRNARALHDARCVHLLWIPWCDAACLRRDFPVLLPTRKRAYSCRRCLLVQRCKDALVIPQSRVFDRS
jgi:hypothetical protein